MEATTSVEDVFASAVDAFQAFLPAQAVAARVRLLSLNATLAAGRLGARGAPFQVVARQLAAIAPELDALIADLEQVFGHLVRELAAGVQRQDKIARYERALHAAAGQEEAESTFARAMTRQHADYVMVLGRIDVAARDLRSYLHKIEWLASKHTFAVAMNAAVEAARAGEPSLQTVAADITKVAIEVRSAIGHAAEQITTLNSCAAALIEPSRQELIRSGDRA